MNAPRLIRWLSALALAAALNLTASAQVLSYTGGTLTENLDGMGASGPCLQMGQLSAGITVSCC